MAVGSHCEASGATLVNSNEIDTTVPNAGAVYIYSRSGSTWTKEAFVKASNTRSNMFFGQVVALAGGSLAVAAPGDRSNAMDVDGNESNLDFESAGAVFLFGRASSTWSKRAYVKASNTRTQMFFGRSLALTSGGMAVGAPLESSDATLLNGNQTDSSASTSGALYLY